MPVIHMTLEREPLQVADMTKLPQHFTQVIFVGDITIGVRVGLAFRANSDEMYHEADCWFCVHLYYPKHFRADGTSDFDQIITNGDEFWRARRSLGKSPLVLTPAVVQLIEKSIAEHLTGAKQP